MRGSKRGEMIARCVVELGTSSFYSAIRDATAEPVLKEVAGRIAADEFRHYRLFYDILQGDTEPDLPRWRKLWVAVTRVRESDDDELACAYYCANVPAERESRDALQAPHLCARLPRHRDDALSPPPHRQAGEDGGEADRVRSVGPAERVCRRRPVAPAHGARGHDRGRGRQGPDTIKRQTR